MLTLDMTQKTLTFTPYIPSEEVNIIPGRHLLVGLPHWVEIILK